MSHGATQVDEPALCQEDDVVAVSQGVPVHLRLDVGLLGGVLVEPRDVDLAVKVANVADDGVVLHLAEVLADEDVLAAGGGHEDVAAGHGVLHGGDLITREEK